MNQLLISVKRFWHRASRQRKRAHIFEAFFTTKARKVPVWDCRSVGRIIESHGGPAVGRAPTRDGATIFSVHAAKERKRRPLAQPVLAKRGPNA